MSRLEIGDRVQVNDHGLKRWGQTGTIVKDALFGVWVRWDYYSTLYLYSRGELAAPEDPVWIKKRTFINATLG